MRELEIFKPFLGSLPEKPGVYLFEDSAGEVMYVGKSVNLRRRVSSYFQKRNSERKCRHLRARVKKIEFLVTGSESEALEVERDLIRSLNPEYNFLYLDYGHFPYLTLDAGNKYPALRIELSAPAAALSFGPFRTEGDIKQVYNALRRVYPVRGCRDLRKKTPCFEFHLERCPAPCVRDVSSQKYKRNIRGIRSFLSGEKRYVLGRIRGLMETAAGENDFERAALYRDQLEALESLTTYQPFLRDILDADVWAESSSKTMLLQVRDHRVDNFFVWRGTDSIFSRVDNFYRDNLIPDRLLGTKKFRRLNGFSFARPQTAEEDKLIHTLRKTLSAYNSIKNNIQTRSKIVDEVSLESSEIIIQRKIGNSKFDCEKIEVKRAASPEESLLKNYELYLHDGGPLPDKILLDSQACLQKLELAQQGFSFNIQMETSDKTAFQPEHSGNRNALG